MDEVYITGSRGFLGSNLVKRLDDSVAAFYAIPHERIQETEIGKFDKFFFLSAYGNLHHQQDDNEIVKANISDLIHVLKQIDWKAGFKSFVYVSTSSVRLKRQTMYSRTKRSAEEILLAYAEKYNAPIAIVRPYSVTGVGEQSEHLIPKLIRSCLYGEKIDFVKRPVHDFIDVQDVIDGILNLSSHKAKGFFELGTGRGYTNQQVLEIVEKVTGKKANINVIDSMRDYDNEDWICGNYMARKWGWLPKISLEESITKMVAKEKQNA